MKFDENGKMVISIREPMPSITGLTPEIYNELKEFGIWSMSIQVLDDLTDSADDKAKALEVLLRMVRSQK